MGSKVMSKIKSMILKPQEDNEKRRVRVRIRMAES
jgi:hypothetical protein